MTPETDHSDPIGRVKASDGDLVLDFDARIGARPYARYVNGEWDLMSLTYVPTPAYGQDDPDAEFGTDTRVHTVDLEPEPRSEEELREIARQERYPGDDVDGYPGVSVISYEESPFAHREDIPAKGDIVREAECAACGESFRQYLPDPFEECPHCGAAVDTGGGETA